MKKKLLAILVAAMCLASILVLPVPASATDPNEEGLTITEDFSGSKINSESILEFGSFKTGRTASLEFEEKDGMTVLKGQTPVNGSASQSSKCYDYLKADMKQNTLTEVTGKFYRTQDWKNEWRLIYKKDSSDNYYALTVDLPENTSEMRYLYTSIKYSDSPKLADENAWYQKGGAKFSNNAGITTKKCENITKCWLDFSMSYDYDKKTVAISYSNPKIGWKCTNVFPLSDGDEPVCMFLSCASNADSYLTDFSFKYSNRNVVAPSVNGVSLTTNDDGVIDSEDSLDLYFNINNPKAVVKGYKITQSGTVMILKNKYDSNGNNLYIGVNGSVEAKTEEFYENYSAILLGSREKVPGHKIAARPYVVYTSETDPSDSFVCYGDVYDAHSVYSCFSAIQG